MVNIETCMYQVEENVVPLECVIVHQFADRHL